MNWQVMQWRLTYSKGRSQLTWFRWRGETNIDAHPAVIVYLNQQNSSFQCNKDEEIYDNAIVTLVLVYLSKLYTTVR